MKIQIITDYFSGDLENKVNQWIAEKEKQQEFKIISTSFNASVMINYFENSQPPMICNQWNEYTLTIVYTD